MPRRQKVAPLEPPTTSTELVSHERAQLPGAIEVDVALLDDAVAEINRIYVGKGLEMYFAVGEYVLNTFFDGEPSNLHAKGRGHATFRALGTRDDLRLSYSGIYNAVAVVEQRRLLPDHLAAALSFSHQVKLLPVKDESEKVELARKAVEGDLSCQGLAAEVRRLKESQREGARLGRPNLPGFVKAFGKLRSIREQAVAEPITAQAFSVYGPEKTKILLADVEHWIRGLQETAEQVRNALYEYQANVEEPEGAVVVPPDDEPALDA